MSLLKRNKKVCINLREIFQLLMYLWYITGIHLTEGVLKDEALGTGLRIAGEIVTEKWAKYRLRRMQ